LAYSSQRVVS